MESSRGRTAAKWLATLCVLLAFGAPLSAARAIDSIRPEFVCDPFGSYSSFALPGWREPRGAAVHMPVKLVALDGQALDWSRGQRSLLETSERLARSRSEVTATFEHRGRTESLRTRLVRVESRALLTILLYHCAIALCLLSSAGIVGTLAKGRSGVRAYTTLALTGTVFLCTFLEYHFTGAFTALFVAANGASSIALGWLAWSFPREPAVSTLARRAVFAGFWAFAVFTAAAAVGSIVYWSPVWVRATFNFATMISLLGLAVGVLARLRSSAGRERAALRSALFGFVAVPIVIVLTQGLALVSGVPLTHVVVPLGGVSIPFSIGYALVRHNAFESRVVVRRAQLSLPIAGLATAALLALAALVAALPPRAGGALVAAFATVASFVLVFALFRRASERYLFPSAPQYQPLISSLSDRVSRLSRRSEVIEAIRTMLRETHNIGAAEVLTEDELDALDPSVRAKLLRGESHWEGPSFDSQRLLVPMVSHEKLRAVMSVTPRGAKLLSSDDVALISTVASLGAVALHHAQVLAEIKSCARSSARSRRSIATRSSRRSPVKCCTSCKHRCTFFERSCTRAPTATALNSKRTSRSREKKSRASSASSRPRGACSCHRSDESRSRCSKGSRASSPCCAARGGSRIETAKSRSPRAFACAPTAIDCDKCSSISFATRRTPSTESAATWACGRDTRTTAPSKWTCGTMVRASRQRSRPSSFARFAARARTGRGSVWSSAPRSRASSAGICPTCARTDERCFVS
ncbi:MAG: hypothetical protein U0269_08650 [Polyangiales bacterium]